MCQLRSFQSHLSLGQMAIGQQLWVVFDQFHRCSTDRGSPYVLAVLLSPPPEGLLPLRHVMLWDPLSTHMYAA